MHADDYYEDLLYPPENRPARWPLLLAIICFALAAILMWN